MTNDEMMEADRLQLNEHSREVHEAAFLELQRLANGGEPTNIHCGICANLDDALEDTRGGTGVNGYDYASGVFYALGYRTIYPLGYVSMEPWEGEDGIARRELAGRMADWIRDTFLS